MKIFNKTDVDVLKRGLKRVVVALVMAATFVIAVLGFIVTAIAPGYLAVILFLASILMLVMAFALLYAQGINRRRSTESKGESK